MHSTTLIRPQSGQIRPQSGRVVSQRSSIPPVKKGWLKKKARSGLFKNWKTRFFVLAEGKISYYRKEISESPYGYGLRVRK
jgi:hypothetical protein